MASGTTPTQPRARPGDQPDKDGHPASHRVDPRALLAELRARIDHEALGRERAEDALRQLQKALETMQLGVTVTDVEGRIVYTNPADAAMHGYTLAELIGHDVGIFSVPEERQRLSKAQLKGVSSWQRDSINLRKDGSRFPVRLLSDVVLDANGDPVGVVTTCEDITERKQAEEVLRHAYDELDKRVLERTTELSEANVRLRQEMAERQRSQEERLELESQLRQAQKMEALGRLTGGIAHDFNNLLTVMLANAELVGHSLPPEYEHLLEELDQLQSAGRKARDLVKKLLGFARQEELSLKSVDLSKVITDLERVLRRLIPEDIAIELAVEESCNRVLADPMAVEQIVINLATNARDAMPNGGTLRIALERVDVDATHALSRPGSVPGEYCCVRVSDTGVGMDQDVVQRVFEPFFTTKPPDGGTGLGMSMIYGLMSQQGGFVELESEKGKGTVVKLFFPHARVSAPSAAAVELREEHLPRGTETILLVEDEQRLRITGKRILERFGYTVLAASDGLEALELMDAASCKVDIVVSDIVMPNMNGYELRDALRLTGNRAKFLFTTGYAGAEAHERMEHEFDAPLLPKPWTLTELVRGVRAVLDEPADR
ncbi:MAG: PAS domain S-box protein [Gemmatimonadota bacterium]|nr:MAG: PAS domain S-box protein [Gemmatimonadota bacterium]